MSHPLSLEDALRKAAVGFDYPPTPPLNVAVQRRLGRPPVERRLVLLRGTLLALVFLLAATLAVPAVRAQVLEFLRIGVVRIIPAPPTATVKPVPTAKVSIGQKPLTATPRLDYTHQSSPDYIISMQGLSGETTLEEARKKLPFTIHMPALPEDLGKPDRVFIQEDNRMVILVWLDSSEPSKVRLSLHEIAPGAITITKYQPPVLVKTRVNGHEAAWVEGPYLVGLTNGDMTWRRLVEGKTLIWEEDGVTYRLESSLSLEEAQRIAESLK